MRLIFDLQALQNGSRGRGIGRYVLHLFKALAQEPNIDLFGLLHAGLNEHFDEARQIVEDTVGKHRMLVFTGMSPTRAVDEENLQRRLISEAAYEEFLSSLQFDALLVGSLFEGFMDDTIVSLRGTGYRKFVILYDLIPLLNPDQYLTWEKLHRWYHSRLEHLSDAHGLLAISQSARREALDQLRRKPDEVFTIGTATDPEIFNDDIKRDPSILKKLGVTHPFVMHASAIEGRKNFEGLIEAFAKLPSGLRRQHQLVLAGHAEEDIRSHLVEVARSLQIMAPDIVFTGFVDDAELAQLYRHCALFVFPSFHEGFGLPALEAMSCGCATIGSNRSSIPEVIGRTDLLFDPSDNDEMSRLMAKLLSNESERKAVADYSLAQAQRFSWKTVAANAAEAMVQNRSIARIPSRSLERAVRNVCKKLPDRLFGSTDRLQLARALVSNEQQANAQVGRLAVELQPTWSIEGPFDSSYSVALLNRETAKALDQLGYRVVLHSSEQPDEFDQDFKFLTKNPDLAKFLARSGTNKKVPDTVSSVVYSPSVKEMRGPVKALLHYAWGESGFPQEWALSFNQNLDMMTCISRHVEKIMIDSGVTVPLLVSGCGVDHWDRVKTDRSYHVDGLRFRFLHVSSCAPRKGADLLLAAYGAAFTDGDDVSLIIKTNEDPNNQVTTQLEILRQQNPKFPHVNLIVAEITDSELKSLYEQCDVMVGPSCAEEFGLSFAQAMLSGLPVITTNWGGQLDFCNDGNSWLIDFEFERAQTDHGLWSSVWARANVGDLAVAMWRAWQTPAWERRAMADRGRRQLLESDRWSDVALRLSAARAQLPFLPVHQPKVGWVTPWGGQCRIAAHSAHLRGTSDLTSYIFAPTNEDQSIESPGVIRCWTSGWETEGYEKVHSHCLELEIGVLVIQFDHQSYDHRGLAKLIEMCRDDNIRVVVLFHSAINLLETDEKPLNLDQMIDAFLTCDRVFVYSILELNRFKSVGLLDNVTLFPYEIVDFDTTSVNQKKATMTVTANQWQSQHCHTSLGKWFANICIALANRPH